MIRPNHIGGEVCRNCTEHFDAHLDSGHCLFGSTAFVPMTTEEWLKALKTDDRIDDYGLCGDVWPPEDTEPEEKKDAQWDY